MVFSPAIYAEFLKNSAKIAENPHPSCRTTPPPAPNSAWASSRRIITPRPPRQRRHPHHRIRKIKFENAKRPSEMEAAF
jgi:hypothetical protein